VLRGFPVQSSVSSARLIATVRRRRPVNVVHEDRFATTFFQTDSQKICGRMFRRQSAPS
jgi:hypothetical protein